MSKKLVLKVIINILLLVVAALGLTYLLVYRQFLNEIGETVRFIDERTRVFYFSALLVFLWLVFLTAVLGRINRSVGATFILILVITYINICKFRLRGTPLLPEDFALAGEAGSLTDFVDIFELSRLVIAIILSVILFLIIGKILKSAKLDIFPFKLRKAEIITRIGILVASVAAFLGLSGFIIHRNGGRYEYVDFLETTLTAWNQTTNYNENGFLIGFLYNLSKLELDVPENYSKERVAEIRREYEGAILEEKVAELENEKPNIVIILNESFIDPEIIRDYPEYDYSGGEITPELHKIQEEAMSGEMFSTDYGGGTANIEFEALTGLTNYWLNTVPYTNLLSKRGKMESIASELKSEGYSTVAIHPYNGGMYKRSNKECNRKSSRYRPEFGKCPTGKKGTRQTCRFQAISTSMEEN